ncbi:MAG: helix-turn-helix domain-containing protein, partial [Ilumatobacteraceae bacterium]
MTRCKHRCIHMSMGSARLPRAQRREQIMVAAASAFVRTGFDATSMDDVARAAGITRLIVYRIFES